MAIGTKFDYVVPTEVGFTPRYFHRERPEVAASSRSDSAAAAVTMDSARMAQMRLDSLRADSLRKDSVAKGLVKDTAAAK